MALRPRPHVSFLVLVSLITHALFPLASAQQPPPAPSLDQRRAEMNRPPTNEQLRGFRDALRQQLERPAETQSPDQDAMESYATDFFRAVWREPKYRYMAGSIIIGEVIIAGMLWKRMRLNVGTWTRQVSTVADVARNMREVTANYARAEQDLLKALAAMEEADRAALLKNLEGTSGRARTLLEGALRPNQTPRPSATPPLSIEQATKNLEKAYGDWHGKAAAETRVLRAAGNTRVTSPATLAENVAAADQRARAVTRLQYTSGEFFKFKNEGLKQMAAEARLNLGTSVGWKTRVWRKARTGLLLLAIPVVAVGIAYYYDKELERNRRLEDLNSASLQDRSRWINTMVPYFHRPLLFAIVRSWRTVQDKLDSPLKRFRCPYELTPVEVDNPNLQVIQSMAMQILLEMEEEGKEVLVENNLRNIVISEEFYRRLFRRILTAENSALNQLERPVLDRLIEDLSYEAFRSFDKLDEGLIPQAPLPPDPALPPIRLGNP